MIFTWYAFMLAALAMVPVAVLLSVHAGGNGEYPVLRRLVMLTGASAGMLQAIGLSRWVFAVPALAKAYVDPAATDVQRQVTGLLFDTLNNWGGIAIGEHLGQLMTVMFAASLARIQLDSRTPLAKVSAMTGFAAAIGILAGLGDGLAVALDFNGSIFSMFTVSGYLALTAWLILTGTTLLAFNGPRASSIA